jgi:prolyl 4-hydroxylase
MSITVDFPAPVRDWVLHNLTRGVDAQAVVNELVTHNTAAGVAAAMVEAVAAALMYGTPLPGDKLEVGGARITYEPAALRVPAESLIRLREREVRVLARVARPAAVLLGGLLSGDECDELIALARPRLVRSTVVDPVTGRNIVAGHRSSDGMFFRPRETPLIARIEERIAELTGLPAENGEGLQMLHYEAGAESTPHVDYLVPGNEANVESIARSGQRVGTMLMYLNDVERGGETLFPQVGCSVVPQRGHAFYFEYGNGTGRSDPASLHASAPVLAGEKWVATTWIRTQRFVARGDAQEPRMT